MRWSILYAAFLLAGCGKSTPQADMPSRTWQYYVAHPAEIAPMQKICRDFSGSNAPAGAEPAVVTSNCRAAAFAKSQRQINQQSNH